MPAKAAFQERWLLKRGPRLGGTTVFQKYTFISIKTCENQHLCHIVSLFQFAGVLSQYEIDPDVLTLIYIVLGMYIYIEG